MSRKHKFFIRKLGCPKNDVDADYIISLLRDKGLEETDDPENADILIVNSCSFIDDAKEESIEAVLEFGQMKGTSRRLVLAGCMAQQFGQQLYNELPEVDVFAGNKNLLRTAEVIQSLSEKPDGRILECGDDYDYWYRESMVDIPNTFPFAYLKIAEGCDNRCSYCTIPEIRGNYRSLPKEIVINQARGLIQNGFKELILVAQDSTDYGKELYGNSYDIAELIADLSNLDGDFIIRLMYANPSKVSDRLINALKHEKVANYIDIPIQHISDKVLADMNRKMDSQTIMAIIAKLKEEIPDIALRTTIMTGFPTESEDDFRELVSLVESNFFLHLGAFACSPQENTPADRYADIFDADIAQERKEILEFIQLDNSLENNSKLIGKTIKVLVDNKTEHHSIFQGRTLQDAPEIDRLVELHGRASVGDFVMARVQSVSEYEIITVIV